MSSALYVPNGEASGVPFVPGAPLGNMTEAESAVHGDKLTGARYVVFLGRNLKPVNHIDPTAALSWAPRDGGDGVITVCLVTSLGRIIGSAAFDGYIYEIPWIPAAAISNDPDMYEMLAGVALVEACEMHARAAGVDEVWVASGDWLYDAPDLANRWDYERSRRRRGMCIKNKVCAAAKETCD